jgi:predicted transcriptional regulator
VTQERGDVYALTTRLDRALAERLKVVAFRERKSMSEIAGKLIESYVERKEREWTSTT